MLFAAALGINDWNVRPQGITFLFASLFLLAIYKYKKNPQWGWLVVFPLGMLVWVNSHGTFIIGLVLIGIWWGQELWQAIMQRINREQIIGKNRIVVPGIMFGITALTCLINPRGFGIIDYLKTLTSNSVVQNLVTEWAPPTFKYIGGSNFLMRINGKCGFISAFTQKAELLSNNYISCVWTFRLENLAWDCMVWSGNGSNCSRAFICHCRSHTKS